MTASAPQSASSDGSRGAVEYQSARSTPPGSGAGMILPSIALAGTVGALPLGLGVTLLLPKFGFLSRSILPWPERIGFSNADWAGFLTVVGLALIGAFLGHWCRERSKAHSLRGRAMATLASYGGFLILIGCVMVMLNAVTRV